MDWGLLTADRPDGGGLGEESRRYRTRRWLVVAGTSRFAVAFVDENEFRRGPRPRVDGRLEVSSSGL
ncbi:hypothetical protein [Natronorubrum tibetense]|uniref:Uncharacterized protein n=1 Tax=Natronorubrum tibetense GA33 TaxID=1114856 RepID=L9VXG5_9EURY|nr:hypothetical protein [Natronorubrum tibetense]ELY41880.1 hypothetical protein C496_08796 [Natronorubrum tibetense GA33]